MRTVAVPEPHSMLWSTKRSSPSCQEFCTVKYGSVLVQTRDERTAKRSFPRDATTRVRHGVVVASLLTEIWIATSHTLGTNERFAYLLPLLQQRRAAGIA